jgi:hypothetical protein
MGRNSLVTMVLALIQILVSGALLGYLLIVHGVLVLFNGTGDLLLSRGLVLFFLRYSFYIFTGLSLIVLRNKFALILAYVAAIIAMADISQHPVSAVTMAILVFHLIYLVWFIWISDSYFEKPTETSPASNRCQPPALPNSLAEGMTDGP